MPWLPSSPPYPPDPWSPSTPAPGDWTAHPQPPVELPYTLLLDGSWLLDGSMRLDGVRHLWHTS